MHLDLGLILVVMVLGCAAFVFVVLYLVCRALGVMGRGLFGTLTGRSLQGRCAGPGRGAKTIVCPNANCRAVEVRDARFCSRCGRPLMP